MTSTMTAITVPMMIPLRRDWEISPAGSRFSRALAGLTAEAMVVVVKRGEGTMTAGHAVAMRILSHGRNVCMAVQIVYPGATSVLVGKAALHPSF